MKHPAKTHYGAGLTWTRNGASITVGRNWPVCSGSQNPRIILRMDPKDVTCEKCKVILRFAGLLQ